MFTRLPEAENVSSASAANVSHDPNRWRIVARFVLLSLVCGGLLAVATAMAFWRAYGSVSAGIAKLQGYALAVDSSSKFVGAVPRGTTAHASFELTNLESGPVTILGAQTSCRCTTVSDLPLTLAPGERSELMIAVTPSRNEKSERIRTTALLFLDVASRRLLLTVEARVVPAAGEGSAALVQRGS